MWRKLKEIRGINTYNVVILRSYYKKNSPITIAHKDLR